MTTITTSLFDADAYILPTIRPGLVEEGWYKATVLELGIAKSIHGPAVRFMFQLESGHLAWATVNLSGDVNSKLFRWASILLGKSLTEDDQLEMMLLRGRRCMVHVKPSEHDSIRFNKVTDIKPLEADDIHPFNP